MEKFIPYEKLSKKGSDPTAAGGGSREGSEWQRSARCKSTSLDAASAGHRNRDKRKIDQARRQTWGALNPVTRKPENSRAYNRKKARNWKRDYHEPIPGFFIFFLLEAKAPHTMKALTCIEQGKIDTTPLITHRYKLEDIEEAYHLFENKLDGVIKVAVEP